MKKLNKKQLGMLALSVLVLGNAYFSASAYQSDYTQKGPNYSEEKHESMTATFETNDYNAWKDLMSGKGRSIKVVNEGNFA